MTRAEGYMKRKSFGIVAAVAVALAFPAGAGAQEPFCDQPHSLDPPRLNCGPESVLNEFLALLDPIWP